MMLATWLRRFRRSNGDVIFMRAALVVIFAAFVFILLNTAVDLLYPLIDPRLRKAS